MTEEESQNTSITNDDLDVLRVLLHSIKGISPVSTVAEYLPGEDVLDQQ
jgi:hypothetical protein